VSLPGFKTAGVKKMVGMSAEPQEQSRHSNGFLLAIVVGFVSSLVIALSMRGLWRRAARSGSYTSISMQDVEEGENAEE
jgi:hypothetical protein